jgi:hypothetical protein
MHGHRRSFRFVPDQGTWDAAGSGRSGEAPGAKRSGFASWRALVRSDGRGRAPVACCRNPSSRCPGVRRAGAEGKGRAPRVGAGDARTPGVPGGARDASPRRTTTLRGGQNTANADAPVVPARAAGEPAGCSWIAPREEGAAVRVGKLRAREFRRRHPFEWSESATESSAAAASVRRVAVEGRKAHSASARRLRPVRMDRQRDGSVVRRRLVRRDVVGSGGDAGAVRVGSSGLVSESAAISSS